MINAAGMTAEEAQAYLSELGVDAEVTTDTEEQDTSSTYTNLIPHIVNTTATYTLPSGDGFNPSTTTEVSIPSITYEAVPQTSLDRKSVV